MRARMLNTTLSLLSNVLIVSVFRQYIVRSLVLSEVLKTEVRGWSIPMIVSL